MTWKKLGRIFDPKEFPLSSAGEGFAQAPHALVLDDRVRIYVSTRTSDRPGMYLCHVAFVDFDRDLRRVLQVSCRPVLELGETGCFDEHGIFPFHALCGDGEILAYYTGLSRRVSVPVDASIGLAVSRDQGVSFERYGPGPVMSASLHEPFLIADGFVERIGGEWHMWYIFGTRWQRESETGPYDRIYKIAHATSTDGIRWRRNGQPIIPDRLDAGECQAMPTVFRRHESHHMIFCYRPAHGFRERNRPTYRLGYAHSSDLVHWTRDDRSLGIDLSADGWDSEMQCYPHVFWVGDACYLLYNGNEFGRHGFGLALWEP